MRHVFVETNWVYDYAAPAHHKRLSAVELLQRAKAGEIQLHVPAPCLTEARRPIVTKCQPRHEADAVRRFLEWAKGQQTVSLEQEWSTREVLDRFEGQVRAELKQLDDTLSSLLAAQGIEVFPLNQRMLDRALGLSVLDLTLKPFDQAILAAILVRAAELRSGGETDLCFCETDADLQPQDRQGNWKRPLKNLYDAVSLWVYSDFDLRSPERPEGWPTF